MVRTLKPFNKHLIFSIFLLIIIFNLSLTSSRAKPTTRTDESGEIRGEIDPNIFLASLPKTMIVGEKYCITLKVDNTGDITADYVLHLNFPFQDTLKYFYYQRMVENVTLPQGASEEVEFSLIPLISHLGPLEFTANLYSCSSDRVSLIDSISADILQIKASAPPESLYLIAFAPLILITAFTLVRMRNNHVRRDALITIFLFMLSLTLRLPNLSLVSIYPDEITIWLNACKIISENWKIPNNLEGYPPLFFYMEAVLVSFFGYNIEVLRIVQVLAGSLTVVVLYFLGKSLFDEKIGFLASLLLCFYGYHILFSRIAMMETQVLLLNMLFMYFLWSGYKEEKTAQMILSGFFLGLNLVIKYISLIMIPFTFFFIIWMTRSWKPIFDKKILLWLLTIFLIVSPVLITIFIKEANPLEWFLTEYVGRPRPGSGFRSFQDLIYKGFQSYVYVLGRGGSHWLPWITFFELAVVLLLPIALLYHAHRMLNGRVSETFILTFFSSALLTVAINPHGRPQWVNYTMPALFLMISNLSFKTIASLKNQNRTTKQIQGAMLTILMFFVIVFCSTNILIGVTTPFVDRGEFDGLRKSVIHTSSRIEQGDVLAEYVKGHVIYYTNQLNLNISDVGLVDYEKEEFKDMILRKNDPKFIFLTKIQYDFLVSAKSELIKNYIVTYSATPSTGYIWYDSLLWLVFERIDE